jgi:hypothetical protein
VGHTHLHALMPDLCLDNTDGRDMNGNQVQVWRCTKGNTFARRGTS